MELTDQSLKEILKEQREEYQRYLGILQEESQSQFKLLAEALDGVEQKLDGVEQKLDGVEQKLDGVEQKTDATFEELGRFKEETAENFTRVDERLDHIELRLDRIETEVRSIKNELQELKHTFTNKTDIEKFQELEKRVMRIEEALKLKMTNS